MANIAPVRINPVNISKQLSQYLVGFDELFENVEKVLNRTTNNTPSFPPRNIIRFNENRFCIQYAVAGYSKDELSVSVERENVLVVKGIKSDKPEMDEKFYLHKGIAFRDFVNEVTIPEGSIIDVTLVNGLLDIDIKKPVKEEPKPKLIAIN